MSTYPQVGVGPQSTSALYGRKYSLTITTPGANGDTVMTVTDSSFEPEALRITFDVHTPCVNNQYWYADIDVYNFSPDTTVQLIQDAYNIQPGMLVTLKAGYQNGNYDVIWQSPLFQPTWVRENVTDFRLSLHCVFDILQATQGTVLSAGYGPNFNQAEVVTSMIESLGLQLMNADGLPSRLSDAKLPRDKVVFGSGADILSEIAKNNKMVWFLTHNAATGKSGIYFDDPAANIPTTPAYVYTPTTGLIGTPVQQQNGVDFSVLLDARIKPQIPWQMVGIQQAIIQQATFQPQPNGYPPFPLSDPVNLVVADIHHRGDTRGDLWQTDITGITPQGETITRLIAAA